MRTAFAILLCLAFAACGKGPTKTCEGMHAGMKLSTQSRKGNVFCEVDAGGKQFNGFAFNGEGTCKIEVAGDTFEFTRDEGAVNGHAVTMACEDHLQIDPMGAI